jgi:heat-inducible transcriptional repressor
MGALSERGRAVLYAAVTEFINTGEPVASRTLSSRYRLNLSAATIRNVLKDLEEEGYLTQPHPSAGRLPTRPAYQLFIDALMRVRQVSPQDEGRIRELFQSDLDGSQLLRESGRLLSDLSGVPAVILRTRGDRRFVQKVRFIPTRPLELLSVVVLSDGSVENRFIHLEKPLDPSQLERVHLLLDEETSGQSLSDLRVHLSKLAEMERSEIGVLRRLSEELLGSALGRPSQTKEILIEGRTSLLQGQVEPEDLRRLLVALEDREQLVDLLDKTLAERSVQVFLGSEEEGSPLSVVAASYRGAHEAPAGALGVLGPTRMNYPELVPLVGAMAQAMTHALSEEESDSDLSRQKIHTASPNAPPGSPGPDSSSSTEEA